MKTSVEISVRGGEETVVAEYEIADNGLVEIVEICDTHGNEYDVSDYNYSIILEECEEHYTSREERSVSL